MDSIPDFDIRYTYLTDAQYLREWLMQPQVEHWFPVSGEKEIEDAIQCWIGFCRFSCSLTATIDGVPCGIGTLFLMPYRKVAHQCLFKLVVDPAHQRKGIGTSLLKNLKHLAKNQFHLELMYIEVFEGNPLISILHKFKFTEFARQENYVKENDKYLARILLESFL